MSLDDYLRQVNTVISTRNLNGFMDVISLRSNHTYNRGIYIPNPERIIGKYLDEPFFDIIASHIRCLWSMKNGIWNQAFMEQTSVVQGLIKCFGREDTWVVSGMVIAAQDLRHVALRFDQEPQPIATNKPREPLEKAAETIMACFRVCSSDNRSSGFDTKKLGMLSIVNELFKLYFKMSKLHLMKPLIRTVDLFPYIDKFPISQQITYKYFVGRKAMYDSQYDLANEYLSFAFERCHKACKKNKRLILIYLIPVKILLGFLPKKFLLEKYNLLEMWDVREAVKLGCPRDLTIAITTNQELFIKSGIYLILERLRFITYRNLFKKVYNCMGSPVVPLGTMLTALHLMDSKDMQLEEATCILSNLIQQGKVKGYISNSHQKVVFSKVEAFPKVISAL